MKGSKTKGKAEAKDSVDGKKSNLQNLIIPAAIIFIALAVIVYSMGAKQGKSPETGADATAPTVKQENAYIAEKEDIVTVNYVGLYPNGTIFDTSYENTSKEAGIYNPLRKYGPITFTVGTGGLLKTFEAALLGMKVGEEKTVTLTPEEAYGYPKNQLVVTEPKLQVSQRIQNVSITKFRTDVGIEPKVGLVFDISNKTGQTWSWNMTVLEITNDTVYIRHDPTQNTTFSTPFGPATITTNDTNIVIYIDAKPGRVITIYGPAVMTTDEENYTVDFNHELAGKTIMFRIKLEGLIKQQ